MAFNKEQFIADLEAMTVLELKELVSALEEHFGVTAAAPVAVAAAGPVEAAEEKTEFDVVLKNAGGNKIAVIKEVEALAKLPSRDQLLSMLLNSMLGPIRKLAYATVAIADKKEGSAE